MQFLLIVLSLFHMMHVERICHKIKAAISSLVTTDSLCYCDLRVRSSTDVVRRKYILITNASWLIQPRGPYGPWDHKPLHFLSNSVFSQPTSSMTSISDNEINIRIPLCDVQHLKGILNISLKVYLKTTH